MKIIILNALYWITYYYCISFVLDRVRHKLNYKFNINLEWIETIFKVRKWKERYPEVSEIDKNDFLNNDRTEYHRELNLALLVHVIPFIFLIPFLFTTKKIFLINFFFIFFVNIGSILIVSYNLSRLNRMLIRKEKRQKKNNS